MTRLVGRTTELAELEKELQRASHGEFRCVLVSADPGIGKTRLVAELLARSRRRTIGLSARGYPLGRTASFGLWAEALDRHLRDLLPERVMTVCGGFLEDLASLLRSVAAVHGGTSAVETPRFRLFEGLAVVVKNLAAKTPVVIALDDLHHADGSSWEALNYLAHNLPESRVLVVGAVRSAELPQQPLATEMVLGLEQEGILQRLTLGPLRPESVAELAEAVLDRYPSETLVTWLTERSQGNPLFVLGLLKALLDEGADLAFPRLRHLPEGLAERVTSRLKLLDEPAIATLEMLAVLGRPVDVAALARLSDRPLERLGEILQGLVRTRLVVEEEQGRQLTYDIFHPLVHDAVYQGIGGARRRALHPSRRPGPARKRADGRGSGALRPVRRSRRRRGHRGPAGGGPSGGGPGGPRGGPHDACGPNRDSARSRPAVDGGPAGDDPGGVGGRRSGTGPRDPRYQGHGGTRHVTGRFAEWDATRSRETAPCDLPDVGSGSIFERASGWTPQAGP